MLLVFALNDGDRETNVPFRIRSCGCRFNVRSELRRCPAGGFRRDHDAARRCAAFSTDRGVQPCRELGALTFHQIGRLGHSSVTKRWKLRP